MKYDTSIYRGVFCALNAIYDKNDNINTDAIKALVTKYKQLGVNGIYACGSTGEGFLLSTEERMQVAEAVKEAAGRSRVHKGSVHFGTPCRKNRRFCRLGCSERILQTFGGFNRKALGHNNGLHGASVLHIQYPTAYRI